LKNLEIERKFLLLNDGFKQESFKKELIVQGFLSSVPERTVRVRLIADVGFITVKGIGNESGTTRFEWEKEISKQEAESLLEICEAGIIYKERYFVKASGHIFEIDEFALDNKGLVMAEVELNNEEESFEKPNWLGEEVTGQKKYYNSSLAKNPYKTWKI
jgi:adenylate cyclase